MIEIPRVEIPMHLDDAADGLVETVIGALRDIGFLLVHDVAIDQFAQEAYRQGRRFFALPQEVKRRYIVPDAAGERGFSPVRDESGLLCKDIGPDGNPVADAKEFFAMGRDPRELSSRHRYLLSDSRWVPFYKENRWPDDVVPQFDEALRLLYAEMSEVGARVLRIVARHLGLPGDHFDTMLGGGADMMRLLHYPPLTQKEIDEVTVWGCAHRDLSFITILARGFYPGGNSDDDRSGLWIKPNSVLFANKDQWVRGVAPEGHVFVQVGNLLERFTGDYPPDSRLCSAWHEVRAPKRPTETGRLSAALFKHARPDVEVARISAGEYVLRELGKIGLANAER